MKNIIYILLFLSSIHLLHGQSKEIEKENAKLNSLKNSIEKIEKEISSSKKKEQNSIKYLNDLDNKILLLNNYLNELTKEERRLNAKIKKLTRDISYNSSRIKKLQTNFAKLINWYYKYGDQSELDLFLNSNNIDDALSKYKYVKILSGETKNTLEEYKSIASKLKNDKKSLTSQRKKQRELISAKRKEKRSLLASKEKRKKILAKLRKKKSSLLEELKSKRRAEQKIEEKIAELIRLENERLAKKEEKSDLKEFAEYDLSNFENFIELRGRLNWPVKKGKITRKFGKQKNYKLNTTTINYGIDIKTEPNSKVHAVAGGIVSVIDWIPGFGSVLIITHKNGYRTVYGHLTDISVSQGDKVNSGVILGRVNESLEGNIIHFEIWKNRQNQNPEKWLAKK